IHHAFTEYLQPICRGDGEFVRFEDTRMGNHVFRAIGKRAVTVFLHGPWKPVSGYGGKDVYPADGVIDALIPLLDKEVLPVAFDTRGTPFGTLPGKTSIYSRGYEDFRLQDFCDGYIVFAPFSLFEGVAPIEGFINEGNLERARSNDNDPRFRNASVERFNRSIAHIAASGFDHLY
ncbi:MAG TPA: hypothetical protein VLA34_12245, partial [Candidatus Krumholzibacterium sp.]|nr:hypothetical protein [Candidatus Krumholzibacterium sp.]